jgi:hypothetical protein
MSSVEQRSAAAVSPPPASRPTSRPASADRRWRLARNVILAVLIVFGVVALAFSVSLVRHARAAQSQLEGFKSSLQHNDASGASRHLRDADAQLAVAHRRYSSLPLRVLGGIPVLGWPVSDAGKLIGAGDQLSSAGADALSIYDQVRGSDSKLFHNDTVSLPEVASLLPAADRMVAKMDVATDDLHAIHGQFWELGIGGARASALKRVTQLRTVGSTAQTMLQLTPRMVGADGPRTYLVAVLNPAELQGAGGSALNMLCIRFNNGHMRILQIGSTFDLTNGNTPTHFTPVAGDPWLAGATSIVLGAADASPDFRTSGQELMRGYTAQFGVRLDGIIALDPVAMQGLMKTIPPFTTPGYGEITANNIVPTVLVDSYTLFPNFEQRHVYNTALMTTLLHRVLGGGHMIGKGTALQSAAAFGHLQILMDDPAVQRQVSSSGLLRTLPVAGKSDVAGVYTANANASKSDYWQKRSIDQHVTLHADGSADVVRTVRITNAAPPYAGPGKDPAWGYLTRVLYLKFTTYLPPNATVRSFARDGVALRPQQFTERGLTVLRLNRHRLDQGATSTIVVSYSLPAGSFVDSRYIVATAVQPMVDPTEFSVTVTGPGSCQGALQVAAMRSTTSAVKCA